MLKLFIALVLCFQLSLWSLFVIQCRFCFYENNITAYNCFIDAALNTEYVSQILQSFILQCLFSCSLTFISFILTSIQTRSWLDGWNTWHVLFTFTTLLQIFSCVCMRIVKLFFLNERMKNVNQKWFVENLNGLCCKDLL